MSDLIKDPKTSDSKDCPACSLKPILEKIPTRNASLGGGLTIRRALPQKARRMIGAWCFMDHFGPLNLKEGGLNVAPHPHIGLQTLTWTLAGDIMHRDSLGSEQIIRPGAVNLMTAGRGISHSEESIPDTLLHGVQLWIALPETVRNRAPQFIHYPELPIHEQGGLRVTLIAGEIFGLKSPTEVFSPLIGLDLAAQSEMTTDLPLNPDFEYGILALSGRAVVEGELIEPGTLIYLGAGRKHLPLSLEEGARLFMIGGQPFEEEILLWWNFVARSEQELVEATKDWENQSPRFGQVLGYKGERLKAPSKS